MEGMGAIFELKDKKYLQGCRFLPKRHNNGDFSLVLTAKDVQNCKQFRTQICPAITFFSSFSCPSFMFLFFFSVILERPTLFDTKKTNH